MRRRDYYKHLGPAGTGMMADGDRLDGLLKLRSAALRDASVIREAAYK